MNRCCIALGANLDEPERAFDLAFDQLEQQSVQVKQRSALHRTPAMGADAGPEFLNAAAVLETRLSPVELLALLHDIELRAGRTRTITWGPRTLDLDLLLFEERVLESSALTVPHPLMWFRRFVLQPLAEVADDWRHPTLDTTVRQLRQRLEERPLSFRFPELSADQCAQLENRVAKSLQMDSIGLPRADGPSERVFRFVSPEGSAPRHAEEDFAVVDLTPATPPGSQPLLEHTRCLRPFADANASSDAMNHLHGYLCDVLTAVLPALPGEQS